MKFLILSFLSLTLPFTAYTAPHSLCGDSNAPNGLTEAYIQEHAFCYTSHEPNQVRVYHEAALSADKRLELIENAQESIYIDSFIFTTTRMGKLVLQALVQKKKDIPGIDIKIITDSMAVHTYGGLPAVVDDLKAAGIEIKLYNRIALSDIFEPNEISHRSHQKIFVVDGAHLIIGGRNMDDEYFDLAKSGYLDREIYVHGQLAIAAKSAFKQLWADPITSEFKIRKKAIHKDDLTVKPSDVQLRADIKQAADKLKGSNPVFTSTNISFVADKSDGNKRGNNRLVSDYLHDLMNSTEESLSIENYLFIPVTQYKEAFKAMADNGVKIDLLTNGYAGGEIFTTLLSHRRAKKAQNMGATVHEYSATPLKDQLSLDPAVAFIFEKWKLHTKSLVIDKKTTVFGSYNLDPRSAVINLEDIVVVHDHADIAKSVLDSITERTENSFQLNEDGDYTNGTESDATLTLMQKMQLKILKPILLLIVDQF